jgi:outer membrane protein assembly factor BamB
MQKKLKFFFSFLLVISLLFSASSCRNKDKTTLHVTPNKEEFTDSDIKENLTMKQLLHDYHDHGGLVVHVGCGTGEKTAGLLLNKNFIVQGLNNNPKELEKSRQYSGEPDLDGRLSFKKLTVGYLPYKNNLVNVLFWQRPEKEANLTEIVRVLAPDGIAFIKNKKGWRKIIKQRPCEIDEWPHYRYDAGSSGASRDKRVGPPDYIQWETGPMFMRSHEIETGFSSLVSANGRIYYILDEGPIGITDARFPPKWSLLCRDAFNGILLWKHPLKEWGWQVWNKERENDPNVWLGKRTRPGDVDRLMVAQGDTLYTTLNFGAPISIIDGKSGKILKTLEETEGVSEFIFIKGYMIVRHNKPAHTITAIRVSDGKTVWQKKSDIIIDRSLCAAGNRVFYHTRWEMESVDLETGEELWHQETDIRPAAVIAGKNAVLVMQSSVTLALSAETGKKLWQGTGASSRGRYPDIFLAGDTVWSGRPLFEGRNILTGKIIKKMNLQNVLESGHHRRCYTDRATVNYMITGERGSEFLNLQGDSHMRHNWLRGPCITGMVPANGFFYVPPNQCFCYQEVKMDGFFALGSRYNNKQEVPDINTEDRLEKGTAYGKSTEMNDNTSDDWHTYRNNAERSGSTTTEVATDIEKLWSVNLGKNLTQPIVAGDRVYVVQKRAGTLNCLNINDGELLWSYTVTGPIDSPPGIYKGLVIFGSRDGYVYAIDASKGEMSWRFRAAPWDEQIISYDRLESVWPVHGSVMILNGLVYCSAGRSGFLDGGIYLFALDPVTGKIVHENKLEGPYPDISKPSYAFHQEGYKSDIMTTDGTYLYMGRTAMDSNLQEIETERINMTGNQRGDYLEYRKMPGMRLLATGTFMDNTFFNRTWWMYSYAWPGYHYTQQAPKSGQMLVFDNKNTYTAKHYTTRNRHSPMLFPGNGYLLFADNNNNEPLFYRGEGEPKPIEWEPVVPPETRWSIYQDAAVDKGPGFTRAKPAIWKSWIDVRISAMVLAGDKLYIAGTPDIVPEEDPLAALEGRMGGVLKVVSAGDGSILAEYPLSSEPSFDGLIAAKNRLLLTNKEGKIICMGKKK